MSTIKRKDLTANFCLICCKCENGDEGGDDRDCFLSGGGATGQGQGQLLNRFLTLLGRHVGKKNEEDYGREEGEELIGGVCDLCGELLKAFCELDEQLNRIRLEMDWKVKSVVDKMEAGGRVPARMREVGSRENGGKILEEIRTKRAKILEHCKEKLKRSEPRVVVADVSEEGAVQTSLFSKMKVPEMPEGSLVAPDSPEEMECDFDSDFLITAEEPDDVSDHSHEEKFNPDDLEEVTPDLSRKYNATSPSSRPSRRTRASRTYKEDSDPDFDLQESSSEEEAPAKDNRNSFHCPFCSKSFSKKYKSNMIRHLRDAHALSLKEAKRTFRTQISQEGPTNEDNEDEDPEELAEKMKPFQCTHCPTKFSYQLSLDHHIKKFHSSTAPEFPNGSEDCENLWPCSGCSRWFQRKGARDNHVQKYHRGKVPEDGPPLKMEPEENFEPEVEPDLLEETEETVEETPPESDASSEGDEESPPEKDFQCTRCPTGFTTEVALKKHVDRYHSGVHKSLPNLDHNFLCSECHTGFKLEAKLLRHMQRYHNPSGNSEDSRFRKFTTRKGAFRCVYCHASFTFKQNLGRHIKSRHKRLVNTKPPVVHCSKPIPAPDNDLPEVILETSKKEAEFPFACDLCPRRFAHKPNLYRHRRTVHSDSVDPSSFKTRTRVKTSSISSDRYRFCCPVCPKRFTLRQNLYRHRKMDHSGVPKQRKKYTKRVKGAEDGGNGDTPEFRYLCCFCSRSVNLKSNLVKHLRTVHSLSLEDAKVAFKSQVKRLPAEEIPKEVDGEEDGTPKPYKCPHCSMTFTSPEAKRRHLKAFHSSDPTTASDLDGNPFRCPVCSKVFKYRGMLNTHMLKYHRHHQNMSLSSSPWSKKVKETPNEVTFLCSHCPDKFDLEEDLEYHLQLHGSFPCQFCDAVSTYAPDLAGHESAVHGASNFQCLRCDFSGTSRAAYYRHFLEAHLSLPLKHLTCDLCHLQYRLQEDPLLDHFSTHHAITGVDPEVIKHCDVDRCTAYFLQPFQLFFHKLKVHSLDTRNNCPICQKVFSHDRNMRTHLKAVHKVDEEDPSLPFPCEVAGCLKRFTCLEEAEWHARTYRHVKRDLEPVTCEECGRVCQGPDGLRAHLRGHHDKMEEAFMCDQCGKGFSRKCKLERHREFHKDPGEWKFECTVCGRRFAESFGLERHSRVHSGERPKGCEFCGKRFKEASHLKLHLRTVHKDKYLEDKVRV